MRRFLIFIQLGVCFLSLSFEEVTEKQRVGKIIYHCKSSIFLLSYVLLRLLSNYEFDLFCKHRSGEPHNTFTTRSIAKKINKRIKLYKQTFHFLAISDQLMKENLLKSILHIILLLTFQLLVYYFVTFSIYVNLSTLLLEQRKGEEEYLL